MIGKPRTNVCKKSIETIRNALCISAFLVIAEKELKKCLVNFTFVDDPMKKFPWNTPGYSDGRERESLEPWPACAIPTEGDRRKIQKRNFVVYEKKKRLPKSIISPEYKYALVNTTATTHMLIYV